MKIKHHNPLYFDSDINFEEMGRRKLFFIFCSGILIPLVAFGIKHFLNQNYLWAGTIGFVALIQIVMMVCLYSRKNGKNIYRIYILFTYILLLCWTYKGTIHGFGSIWILGIPPYIFFLLGRKEGTLWVLSIGLITAFIFFNPFHLPGIFAYHPDYSIRHLTLYVIIFIFIYNYETTREFYRNHILSQKNNLEKTVADRTFELHQKNIKLEESKKLYYLIENNISDVLWMGNIDHFSLNYISPSVSSMLGYTQEEALSLPLKKWFTPDSYQHILPFFNHILEQYRAGQPIDRHVSVECEHLAKDGSVVEAELIISLIIDEKKTITGVAGITRDISERKRNQREKDSFQQQLAQSQKMEAIGTLVAGIAHDFNNFLSGIFGSYDLLRYALEKETLQNKESIERYISTGVSGASRSADLIKQLLAISRKHDIILSPININNAVRHIQQLCKNSFPKSIKLDFQLSNESLMVLADMVQVEQIFLNICINASHAMTIMREPGEKHGGTLTVKTDKVKTDLALETFLKNNKEVVKNWVRVIITDTGVGMNDDVLKHLFDPFFTKNKPDGSGLGLSTSYHIMEKHGGYIHVYSTPGKGSCFSLYFPAHKNAEAQIPSPNEPSELVTGSGTIFVVDDEDMVGNVIQKFLENCGYDVIISNEANEAVECYRERHKEITAVILDLNLPLKSGLEIYTELKKINPDIKALLSSGMIDVETKNNAFELGINDVIRKPYVSYELSWKIKNLTKTS